MQEADMGLTNMALDSSSNARFAADDTLLVRFFKHPKLNPTKTAEEGRPIYVETDYIQIMQPGNKDSIILRPVSQMDIDRFPRHFQMYEARNGDEVMEGTLLDEWSGISRSMVEELKFFNVRTVEQLLGMSDSNAQKLMGINLLRDKAAKYLEVSTDEAAAESLLAAEKRTADLEATVAELLERLDAAGDVPPAPEPVVTEDAEGTPKTTRRRKRAA